MPKNLKSVVDGITELPTLPEVVSELIRLLENPKSSAEDVNKLMEKDISLTAKILRLVNSAYYGMPNKISSVRQAVVILGFSTVKSLAISASVFDMFSSNIDEEVFSQSKFWIHSIGCACLGRVIGRMEAGVDEDATFVLGLMHDIGKLVLFQYAAEEFEAVVTLAQEESLHFYDAEHRVLDTDHAEIGGWLAERWGLAEDVARGIRYHHAVGEAEERRIPAICSFADFITKRKQIGSAGDFAPPALDSDVWTALSLKKEKIPDMIQKVDDEMSKAGIFFDEAMQHNVMGEA